jgi:glycosyltransferase involved in cell wall biosynthesis
MVTSIATAYPYKHDKLVVTGQGIDTDLFNDDGSVPEEPPMILCVGRLSRVKDHPTLLKAVGILREKWEKPFRVVILGGPASSADEAYVKSLYEEIHALDLQGIVSFEPPLPQSELPPWYWKCTIHVNLTPTGSGDKVAWEAMSCGRPCLAANIGFMESFGDHGEMLLFRYNDPEDLAGKIKRQLELSPEERKQTGMYLRGRVIKLHGLDRLADKFVALFYELTQEHS